MRIGSSIRVLLLLPALAAVPAIAPAQASIAISVSFGPPALPVYEQPICPAEDYIWVPGYWAYDNSYGYFWVPGTWVQAPQVGYFWTPGYWGWGSNAYVFHQGYWGPQVGYYGGINYGFGYVGHGYEGGRWQGSHFAYNTYVNHVNTTIIHNTYNTRIVNVTENHISYNGGNGGIQARPTTQEQAYEHQHHVAPIAAQVQHVQVARGNPQLRASSNQGRPPIAATPKPADFKTGVVPSKQAGGEYKPPPTAQASQAHASDVKPHTATPPANGQDQERQTQLAAKQNQQHQQLQQQQEKEHQQAAAQKFTPAQNQQMEQRHSQQTQRMEQNHAAQQQHAQQQHVQQHEPEPKPESKEEHRPPV